MDNSSLRELLERLNDHCARALESAAAFASARTHFKVSSAHLLIKLLEDGDSGDIERVFSYFKIDTDRLWHASIAYLDDQPAGCQSKPTFGIELFAWLQKAWLANSLHYEEKSLRGVALVDAMVEHCAELGVIEIIDAFSPINLDELRKHAKSICHGSVESTTSHPFHTTQLKNMAGQKGSGERFVTGQSILEQFTQDLTARAQAGEIDPVLGRNDEIRMMIDILCRRRKNNPIMVGEPGVGKTAVVEGLAQRIADKSVPEELMSVKLLVLDLGMLQAGAGVKGEFERRLKQVIDDVKAAVIPVILFIDEAHTLIGAGGDAGTSDAANLLKPALARGELKTIAATTWSEYKKYFERDAALERRFQLIKVEEPSEDTAILMLSGLKEKYQKHHGVQIIDDAVESAVRLSSRYLPGRQLPDKAIDLLDTAAARIRMGYSVKPQSIEAEEEHIAYLNRRLKDLTQEEIDGLAIDKEVKLGFEHELKESEEKLKQLFQQWQIQKELVDGISQDKITLKQSAANDKFDALRKNYQEKREKLKKIYSEEITIQPEVNADAVAAVIAEWTGIPAGSMLKNEITTLLSLENNLSDSIIGQEDALVMISKALRVSKSGVKAQESPIGVFLLAGSSGIGKTETARKVAEALFGDERFVITINMSEYQEAHTVSQLKGSPPGYVGYGEGGVLTEAVRQRPYSVVLLDEVEKAHADVMNLFYQVFERGFMRDGEGREIDFKNTIIMMTTNLGSEELIARCVPRSSKEGLLENHAHAVMGETIQESNGKASPDENNIQSNLELEEVSWQRPTSSELVDLIKPAMLSHFAPALLARMQVIPFRPLEKKELQKIVALKLDGVAKNLYRQHKMEMRVDEQVITSLAGRCLVSDHGARMVDSVIEQQLMPNIARSILEFMVEDDLPDILRLLPTEEGGIEMSFADKHSRS